MGITLSYSPHQQDHIQQKESISRSLITIFDSINKISMKNNTDSEFGIFVLEWEGRGFTTRVK